MRGPAPIFFLWFAAIAACTGLAVPDSLAQGYPSKPIRLLVGFTAGSAPDGISRALAPTLSDALGQPVLVENRGGAAGSIATAAVAKAPADGYTLLMMAAADTLQPALRSNLPYDLTRDLAPISMVVTGTAVLSIHPSLPVRDVAGLISLARDHPGKLNYGSSGIGSSSHLMGELFNSMAGVKLERLNAIISKAVNTAEIRALLTKQGLEPQTNTPEEFAAFIQAQLAQNAKLVRLSGAKTD